MNAELKKKEWEREGNGSYIHFTAKSGDAPGTFLRSGGMWGKTRRGSKGVGWWRNCCGFNARSLTRHNTEKCLGTRNANFSPKGSKFVEIVEDSS
jgi:hypothetical protein